MNSDNVGWQIREVFDYVQTTISVMEKCDSFTTEIPEFQILSHIQNELVGIHDTLGELLTKR